MAHISKYKQSQINNIINHDRREHTQGRENINNSLSYLNYNLCDRPEKEYLKKKIEEVKNNGGTVREDSVVLGSIIITLPKTFINNETLQEQFFKSCKRFLDEDFNKDNCISCWVHLDEPNARPHMHYKFTPIQKRIKKYKDGHEKEVLSFNAKKILDRSYFQKFHNRLSDYIEEELGFKVDILNGETKGKNKTIKELKQESEKTYTQKEIINELWQEYKTTSFNYWNNYKQIKKNIDNSLWELKKGITGTEKQLKSDLDFIHNLSYGLIYAIFKLIGALFVYNREKRLQDKLKDTEKKLEILNDARRKISNYQENTKQNLKKEDIDKIEEALEKWENAILSINEDIKNNFITREKEPESIKFIEECR